MYSNSKEQINLEEAYRAVHLEKVEECDCGCGHCEDHKEKKEKKDEKDSDNDVTEEAIDFDTISSAAHTIGHGYKEIYNAFLHNPEFREKMLTYWIGPAVLTAVGVLAKKGFDKGNELRKKYIDRKDKVDKEKLTKELLKNNDVLSILDKLQKMDKDHQHNTAQYIHVQRSLANEIEKYLKEHSPSMSGKVHPGGIWSTYRKQTSFD